MLVNRPSGQERKLSRSGPFSFKRTNFAFMMKPSRLPAVTPPHSRIARRRKDGHRTVLQGIGRAPMPVHNTACCRGASSPRRHCRYCLLPGAARARTFAMDGVRWSCVMIMIYTVYPRARVHGTLSTARAMHTNPSPVSSSEGDRTCVYVGSLHGYCSIAVVLCRVVRTQHAALPTMPKACRHMRAHTSA